MVIVALLVAHWCLAVFIQSSFHHRYASHRMFSMKKPVERIFHLAALAVQGASYLSPRAYAILHREHHAYSDTEKDPHPPGFFKSPFAMMWQTAKRYSAHVDGTSTPEPRFVADIPAWPALERFGSGWLSRVLFGAAWVVLYAWLATAWWQYLLLPVHWMIGPMQGAIVNWCGHRYGYRNFSTDDASRNTVPFDFITWGELFQNNHHRASGRLNFAIRKWEFDPTYAILVVLSWIRVIQIARPTA
jgi:stearoyl-CoA desaturase (Delta-9 desaturase)